jgi:hypothetical protein
MKNELKFNEFGDYDIGLNRFNFGEGIGLCGYSHTFC